MLTTASRAVSRQMLHSNILSSRSLFSSLSLEGPGSLLDEAAIFTCKLCKQTINQQRKQQTKQALKLKAKD
jgi:hypothetical protein